MTPLALSALAAFAAVAALAAAAVLAPERRLETEIRIAAPPEAVWRVLVDSTSYPAWNPFIRAMSGPIAKGARLQTVMQPAGRKAMTFRPVILAADPERELRWLGRLPVPRMFDGEHYFRLEADGTGTRLIHGEVFRGLLLWIMDTDAFRADFVAMNLALKARAESLEQAAPRA